MTSLHLGSIATAISQLSISGVTVKDVDKISSSWTTTPNVLYPHPDNWISNFSTVYNIAGTLESASYNLTYRFLGTQVGDLSTFPAAYGDLVDKLSAVLGALVDTPNPYSDDVEMKIKNTSIGPRSDPAGNNFFGADITLSVEESH